MRQVSTVSYFDNLVSPSLSGLFPLNRMWIFVFIVSRRVMSINFKGLNMWSLVITVTDVDSNLFRASRHHFSLADN